MVKELLRSHSSVRIYDGEPISKEIIEDLMEQHKWSQHHILCKPIV